MPHGYATAFRKTEGMLSVFGGGTSNGGTGSTSNDVAFAGASGGSSDGR